MVSIDKDKCISCELCTEICGEVFEMQIDGKAGVKKNKDIPSIIDAIVSCPTNAISEK